LNGERQLPRIDDQAVEFYKLGQRSVGETARQRPTVVKLKDAKSLSDQLRLVNAGAGRNPKMTA
jgi:hypothetical protein